MSHNNFQSVVTRRQGQLIVSAIFSVISAALGLVPFVAIYLITRYLFVNGLANVDTTYVLTIAGASLLAAVFKTLLMALSLHISHIAAYDILYDVRLQLARKLGSLSLGYFDQNNTGAVKRVIHEHVEKTEEVLAHIIPELAAALAIPVLSWIILLMVDWRMALVLLLSPILGLALFGLMNRLFGKDEMKTYNQMMDRMNSTIIQYINGMKVIKAFTRTNASFADLRQVIDDMMKFYLQMGVDVQRTYAAIPIAFRTGPLFVLPAGLLLYINNSLDLPTFLLFVLIGLGFARPIYNFLMHGMLAFYQINLSIQSIDNVLKEKELPEAAQPERPSGYDIAFHQVMFSYGQNEKAENTHASTNILNNVSFTIPQGSVTALVGPSGAGKTTIARLIPRFWDVTGGYISIGGVDIRKIKTTELMDCISFVFQDVFLFNDTIYENIRVGNPDATRDEIIAAAKMARCHDFIEQLGGYDYAIGENGAKLSGGQRQRLSIARAILKDAPIIVLDEATAFIDPENEALIQEAIAALMTSTTGINKTLIVVAHRLSTITEVDQILLVDDGQIAAAGTHQELLAANPLYQTLWSAHTDAVTWQFTADTPVEMAVAGRLINDDTDAEPFENPFEPLKSAASHWQRVNALVGKERALFRRSIVWSFLEGIFIAYPAGIIYLALVTLHTNTMTHSVILALSLGMLFVFAGQYLFGFLTYKSFLRLDTRIQRNLRLFLSDYLRRLPLGFFSKHDVGYVDALFTTTIEFLETRLTTSIFVSSVVAPLLIFVFTLFLDWRMALAMAVSVPFAVLVLWRGLRVFDQVWHEQREARKQANSRMVEYIQGIGVIRAFNLPGERFAQFEQAMDRYRLASRSTITRITPTMTGFGAVLEIGFAFMLIVGALLITTGTITFDRLLIFMLLGTSFYGPIFLMGDMLSFQRIVANGVNNINEFIATPLLPEPVKGKHPDGYAISFENVRFSYEDKTVLNDVSFNIPQNAMVALVGPSGSGKTTITNLIARFWDANVGRVTVGGVDVRDLTANTLLASITMVFQDVYLFNDTIMNNIKFGNPNATDEQVFTAARAAQCHDFIVEFPAGYSTRISEGGSTLSGGQKQRISIARAILKDAPIVLLDEATASIDPENERLIQQAINALTAKKTLIVIAHRLNTVQYADKIFVLDEGQIIQEGTHNELIAQEGMYRRFWDERQKARGWKLGRVDEDDLMPVGD